jgi:hypothetical protein
MMLVALIWGVTFVLVKNALADIGLFYFWGSDLYWPFWCWPSFLLKI